MAAFPTLKGNQGPTVAGLQMLCNLWLLDNGGGGREVTQQTDRSGPLKMAKGYPLKYPSQITIRWHAEECYDHLQDGAASILF